MSTLTCPPETAPAAPARIRLPQRERATTGGHLDPSIASDGLTIDTKLGPVDLVAVDRFIRGHQVALTTAEDAWLHRRHGPRPVRRQAAQKLGTPHARFSEHLYDYFDQRREANRTTTAAVGAEVSR